MGKLIPCVSMCVCLHRAVVAPPRGASRISVTSIQHWEGDSYPPPARPDKKTQRASRCMGPRLLITQFARWDPSQQREPRGYSDWRHNRQPGPKNNNDALVIAERIRSRAHPFHLTTRHQPGRKVWECHTIRLNAD